MRLWNTIKLAQMTLRLVPEILNPVDVILLVGKEFLMVNPKANVNVTISIFRPGVQSKSLAFLELSGNLCL